MHVIFVLCCHNRTKCIKYEFCACNNFIFKGITVLQMFICGGTAPVLSSINSFYAPVELHVTIAYFHKSGKAGNFQILKETLTFINFFLRFVYDFVYHGSD